MNSVSLNERQRAILALVARGKSNREIAEELYLSLNTIKWYMQGIFRELGAKNRVEAVRLARESGLLPAPSTGLPLRHNLPAPTTPFLGALLYEWNELDEAGAHIEQALEMARRSGNAELLDGAYRQLARLTQAGGMPPERGRRWKRRCVLSGKKRRRWLARVLPLPMCS